jgi:hypothetical protein
MAPTTATVRALSGVLAVTAALIAPARAAAQAPQVGEVQRLQVITLALHVGSMDTETKQATYTPPPGWYVRSHAVECTARYGNSSFTVNTVPQDWRWCSEGTVHDSYKLLIEMAGQAQNAGLQAKFLSERDRLLAELRKVRSSHHALVVEATARGGGLLRGGGGVQLAVTAELVYVGTQDSLSREVAHHRAWLK